MVLRVVEPVQRPPHVFLIRCQRPPLLLLAGGQDARILVRQVLAEIAADRLPADLMLCRQRRDHPAALPVLRKKRQDPRNPGKPLIGGLLPVCVQLFHLTEDNAGLFSQHLLCTWFIPL